MENLTLIKKKKINENESVVLYSRPIGWFTEYVTWIENSKGEKYWGHYFSDPEVGYQYQLALEDFDKRVLENS